MSEQLFGPDYQDLLLDLLHISTTSPIEQRSPSRIPEAQSRYAELAVRCGFEIALHEPPPLSALTDECTPVSVREVAAKMWPEFFSSQPNLLLRLGGPREVDETIAFNFHMDTVDGDVPTSYRDGTFVGRGAVDMKGPGTALLAGIAGAYSRNPGLIDDVTVLIQCVSGEEGGAMGVYGTKVLADQGSIGRLNIVAEPSEGFFFDHATSSMTACVSVDGVGATDDVPQAGDNATLVLSFLAHHLAESLADRITSLGGKMCVAGLTTGSTHNRVFGTGTLLLNFAYGSRELGDLIRREVESAFTQGCHRFRAELGSVGIARQTSDHIFRICNLAWLKSGLPVLSNRDPAMEGVLERAGLVRNPEERNDRAFTCDALWIQRTGIYTIVYGPGSLERNRAHSDGEFVELADLETYAQAVARIVEEFRAHVRRRSRRMVHEAVPGRLPRAV